MLNGKTVLITGVTGFIGHHLVRYIEKYNPDCNIWGICRNPDLSICPSVKIYAIDLLNLEEITSILKQIKPDYIFHLAGLVFSYDWDALYRNNVIATANLLGAIKKSQITPQVVIAGSSAEYGVISTSRLPVAESYHVAPKSPYGISKLLQTMLAKHYQLADCSINIARLFNIIGYGLPRQLTTGDIFSQIGQLMHKQQECKISVGSLSLRRDFLDIEDVCSGLVAIVNSRRTANIYNVCSGRSRSYKEIIDLSIQLTGVNVDIFFDEGKHQNTYVQDIYGCNLKIKRDLLWSPSIALKDSIKKLLSFYEASPSLRPMGTIIKSGQVFDSF